MKDQEIEELLNAYVDGELSQRQYNEVQRLIAHEPEISARIRLMQNTRNLVRSLPFQKAPDGIVEDVRLTLERKNLLDSDHVDYEQQALGKRHLLMRKLLSAAAVLVLAAILGAVVVSIVSPDDFTNSSQIADKWKIPEDQIDLENIKFGHSANTVVYKDNTSKPTDDSVADDLIATLVVHTDDLAAAQAFLMSSLDELAIKTPLPQKPDAVGQFNITCSQQQLAMLAQNLNTVWNMFSSPTLHLKDQNTGVEQKIDFVTAGQVQTVLLEPGNSEKFKKALDFASLNRLAKKSPGRDVESAIDNITKNLLTIPKPVLTSRQNNISTIPSVADSNDVQQLVSLTIILEPER